MPVKHFIINDKINSISKEDSDLLQSEREAVINDTYLSRDKKVSDFLEKDFNLVHVEGRILIKVDLEYKNNYTFANGQEIRLERGYNNLDNAYVCPTQGLVISGDGMPKGALILFHFNSIHDSNRVFNYSQISGAEIEANVGIYSIKEEECFLWKLPNEKEWNPIRNYALGYKVFIPYEGGITGIQPTEIKDVLYIYTGDYAGQCYHTVKNANYRLIFRDPETGRDEEFIRCRPDGDEKSGREPELVAINHAITEKVLNGEYLVGLTPATAKKMNDDNKNAD